MSRSIPLVYEQLAELLAYPVDPMGPSARRLAASLVRWSPQSAAALEEFSRAVEPLSTGRLEEIYTATFDLNPSCYPYAGYQLFGDGYKRGEFLVKLKEKYREHGIREGGELADHLSVCLRFLAKVAPGSREERDMVGECMVPVVKKMAENFEGSRNPANPYRHLLVALLRLLEDRFAELSREEVTI